MWYTRLLLLTAIAVLVLSSISLADSFVYDDFSGSTLDTTKWQEWCPEAGCLEYHDVNTAEGRYHWEQTFFSALKNVNVNLSGYTFSSGDTVDFDFYYVNGSGNGVAYVGVRNPSGTTVGLTEIGYWNSNKADGNVKGLYHYKIEFFDNFVNLTLIRPDDIVQKTISINSPSQLGYSANVGHDGLYHWDWDNFVITTLSVPPQPSCNCTALTERVDMLEQQIQNLTNQITALTGRLNVVETAITSLNNVIVSVQTTLNNFMSKIIGFLSNSPYNDRKAMICGYMRDNGLKNYTALNLKCTIKSGVCFCLPQSIPFTSGVQPIPDADIEP